MTLRSDAAALLDDLVALRRDLHRIPEIGLHLPRTQERVLAALDGLPLEISLGKNLSSITGVLRGGMIDRKSAVCGFLVVRVAKPVGRAAAERPMQPGIS